METRETLLGYVFNNKGLHNDYNFLYTKEDFDVFIIQEATTAFVEGRECIITDRGDGAVFHIKEGKVLFSGGSNCEEMEKILRFLYTKFHTPLTQTLDTFVKDTL